MDRQKFWKFIQICIIFNECILYRIGKIRIDNREYKLNFFRGIDYNNERQSLGKVSEWPRRDVL